MNFLFDYADETGAASGVCSRGARSIASLLRSERCCLRGFLQPRARGFRKPTRTRPPAMAAGVTPKLWSLTDMVRVIEDWEIARSLKISGKTMVG